MYLIVYQLRQSKQSKNTFKTAIDYVTNNNNFHALGMDEPSLSN